MSAFDALARASGRGATAAGESMFGNLQPSHGYVPADGDQLALLAAVEEGGIAALHALMSRGLSAQQAVIVLARARGL